MIRAKEIVEAEKIVEEKILTLPYFNDAFYRENKKTLGYIAVNMNYSANKEKRDLILSCHKGYKGTISCLPLKSKNVDTNGLTLACYYPESNKIYYIKDYLDTQVIAHELCHMASTDRLTNDDKEKHAGYCRNRKNASSSGYGLNEGATEWLVERTMFGNDDKNLCYGLEVRFARLLCLALGDEHFYKAYSEANPALINKKLKSNNISYSFYDIMTFIDYIFELDNYGIDLDLPEDVTDEIFEKELLKVEKAICSAFNLIQKTIIDIYFANAYKTATDEEMVNFAALLVTSHPKNSKFLEGCPIYLEDNYKALQYFLKRLEQIDKGKAKTFKKVL